MPLLRRTVERIQAGEYVDFADFPVIDGGARAMDQAEQDLGDRILVVQAPDRRRSKREVPDASMWGSCFTLFERAIIMTDPERGRLQGDHSEGSQDPPVGFCPAL